MQAVKFDTVFVEQELETVLPTSSEWQRDQVNEIIAGQVRLYQEELANAMLTERRRHKNCRKALALAATVSALSVLANLFLWFGSH